MRTPDQITVDRGLLVYLLHLVEPHGFLGDVKLQQLAFLCELQMFAKGLKGFHFEFFRYAYGAFSKDLDNDLMSLRRKERVENFSVTPETEEALKVLDEAGGKSESNAAVLEILRAVTTAYGPQDNSAIMQSVEKIELSTPDQPDAKFLIRDISFHAGLLAPSRIQVEQEFTMSAPMLARLNAALGY